MPKIPESSAIQMPRVATPSGRLDMMSIRTLDRMSQQLFGLAEQYKRQQQQSEVVELSGDMERELLDLQIEIEQNPEIKTAEEASTLYGTRAKAIVEDYTGRGKWKSVQSAVGARGLSRSISGLSSVAKVGYAREVESARANLIKSAQTAAMKYARAEKPKEQVAALAQWEVDLGLEGHIGEDEKAKRQIAFDMDRTSKRTIHLANEGRYREARAYLGDPEATSVLGPDDVYRLHGTINQAEARAEAAAQADMKDIEEETAKGAFLAIQRSREGLGTVYGITEFERDLPNLSFTDAKAIRTAMSTQYEPEYENPYEVIRLQDLIDDGDPEARDKIKIAYAAGLLKKQTYDSLLDEDRAVNDDRIFSAPYVEAKSLIKDTLGPLPFETRASAKSAAVLRTQRALKELQRFRETYPEAAPADIDGEANRLVVSYSMIDFSQSELTLPTPYGSPSKQSVKTDPDELDRAATRVFNAYESGQIDERRMRDEETTIRLWRALLERQARVRAMEGNKP